MNDQRLLSLSLFLPMETKYTTWRRNNRDNEKGGNKNHKNPFLLSVLLFFLLFTQQSFISVIPSVLHVCSYSSCLFSHHPFFGFNELKGSSLADTTGSTHKLKPYINPGMSISLAFLSASLYIQESSNERRRRHNEEEEEDGMISRERKGLWSVFSSHVFSDEDEVPSFSFIARNRSIKEAKMGNKSCEGGGSCTKNTWGRGTRGQKGKKKGRKHHQNQYNTREKRQ